MDHQFIKKFLKGSAFSSLGTLVTIIVHFVSVKVLAEYMPRAEFGVYAIIIVISHGLQILGGLGLNLTLVRNLSGDDGQDRKATVTAIFTARTAQLLLVSLLVLAVGGRVVPQLFDPAIGPYIVYIPLIFSLASLRELLFHMLQGLQQFNRYAFINILSSLIRLGSILYFHFAGGLTVERMMWVELLTYGGSMLVLLPSTPVLSWFTPRLNRSVFKKIFSFGGPLYANDILTYVYNRISVLLIGGLLTPVSVAMYDIASKIPEACGRLFSSLIVVYFPSVSELLGARRSDEAERFMNRNLILASTALALAALVTFLFREEIVSFVLADQYLEASMALALLMVSFNLNAVVRLMGYTIVAAGHSSTPVRINLVSSVTNVVGCLILIPRYGYIGAVYSLIGMNLLSQAFHWFYLIRANLHPQMGGIAKAPAVMIGLLAGYVAWGHEAIWVRAVFIAAQLVLCWLFIPEVRHTMRYASRYASRLKWLPSRSV